MAESFEGLRRLLVGALLVGTTLVSAQGKTPVDVQALVQQVTEHERAFARSMAERKLDAFAALLSEQAVFYGGGQTLNGKDAVIAGWKAYFDGTKPPFSWEPDNVQVLADGTLALSTGPVRDPAGKPIARFNSVWRQEAPGVWRVVFDKGQPPDSPPR